MGEQEAVKKYLKLCDVIYGRPQRQSTKKRYVSGKLQPVNTQTVDFIFRISDLMLKTVEDEGKIIK